MVQDLDVTTIKSKPDYQLRKRRPTLNCDEPILTDQSQSQMADINNIMLQYTRTGMLPGIPDSSMSFVDDTTQPSFMEAHDQIVFAKQQFNNLPLKLRQELSHDFTKFESWLTDPDNFDRAVKMGLLTKHETPPQNLKAEKNEKSKNDQSAKSKSEPSET